MTREKAWEFVKKYVQNKNLRRHMLAVKIAMSKIYLIRHAESIANTKEIYQGQSYNTELSLLGKRHYTLGRSIFK